MKVARPVWRGGIAGIPPGARVPTLHVRPVVRGKAGHENEFGTKSTASMVDGYIRLEHLYWETYHEADDLPMICECDRARTGH